MQNSIQNSITDYYPFGMTMPGRQYQGAQTAGGSYRFGFNGMEKDGEEWSGNAEDYLYSSAIDYAGGKGLVNVINVNG